jgi:nitroreductase
MQIARTGRIDGDASTVTDPDGRTLLLPDDIRSLITGRQNVSPKRLVEPGPTDAQQLELLEMAGAAPDHGQLTPWRFVIVPRDKRQRLAEVFSLALVDRDPGATREQIEAAREKADRAPLLMLAVVRIGTRRTGDPGRRAARIARRGDPEPAPRGALARLRQRADEWSGLEVGAHAQTLRACRGRAAGVLCQCRDGGESQASPIAASSVDVLHDPLRRVGILLMLAPRDRRGALQAPLSPR